MTAVVEITVEVTEVVEVAGDDVVIVEVDVGGTVVDVRAFVVVEVADEQDANTIEIAMIHVINNPIIPFFISPPVFLDSILNQLKSDLKSKADHTTHPDYSQGSGHGRGQPQT